MISQPDELDKFVEHLKTLTQGQRLLAFNFVEYRYCRHCGREQPLEGRKCQCSNDE